MMVNPINTYGIQKNKQLNLSEAPSDLFVILLLRLQNITYKISYRLLQQPSLWLLMIRIRNKIFLYNVTPDQV